MDKQKFESMLILLVSQLIRKIAENYHIDEIRASRMFYESAVYALLEQEDTKLWHLSVPMLFSMFDGEKKTGSILFPEEA